MSTVQSFREGCFVRPAESILASNFVSEMDESASSQASPISLRKMRKGTRSCTECRRRKIRCVYPPGNRTCFSCSARNSRCIEQGCADHDKALTKNTQLGEGVARTTNSQGQTSRFNESYVDDHDLTAETPDIVVSNDADYHGPLVCLLVDAKLSGSTGAADFEESSPAAQTNQSGSKFGLPTAEQNQVYSLRSFQSQNSTRKATQLCLTLRSVLPSYDIIMSVLSNNGSWWASYYQKSRAVSQTPPITLEAFAGRAYTSNNPAELGALAIAFARSSGKHYQLYSIVDDLVISDITYTATIEGLECLILLAKAYTDGGQPKRAWVVWKKGVTATQLMGLTHGRNCSPTQLRLWTSVYHGDRFCSLLLGLPYAFIDSHYAFLADMTNKSMPPVTQFVFRCANISGQIIDRNLAPGKPSFAKAMEIDEELESIASPLPEDWWRLPTELPQREAELDKLRETLLQQFYFFWVRLYLHMPFLVKSPPNSPHSASRVICMEAARHVLRRYGLLRSKDQQGQCLFECKTTDFACFTATVILLVGMFHCNETSRSPNFDDDLELIASTDRIFEREETERNCKIASQCRKTLRMLSGSRENVSGDFNANGDMREIVIPYFGAIVRKRTSRTLAQPETYHSNQKAASDSHDPTYGSVVADNLWAMDVDAYSLQYIGHHSFDQSPMSGPMGTPDSNSIQNESLQWMDPSAMDLDPGWGILTDMNWDMLDDVDIDSSAGWSDQPPF